jgi:hypothetical protein
MLSKLMANECCAWSPFVLQIVAAAQQYVADACGAQRSAGFAGFQGHEPHFRYVRHDG